MSICAPKNLKCESHYECRKPIYPAELIGERFMKKKKVALKYCGECVEKYLNEMERKNKGEQEVLDRDRE
jgi:hypothetical protein